MVYQKSNALLHYQTSHLRRHVLIQGFFVTQLMVSLSSKESTFLRVVWVGAVLNILKKKKTGYISLNIQQFFTFYLLPSVVSDSSSQISASDSVSCVVQHHLAQHTPHSCGVYHMWFPSNQIPVELYLTLDLRDKVSLVYREFKHRSRGRCTFSKATDHY